MNIYNALIYKKLYGGGGGGEIEVESLTATENKTYNAGEGKAYNPVVVAIPEPTLISKSITANGNYSASADNADGYSSVSVNVPLPSNAYLLKSIEHEQVATFADGTDNFVKSLEVAIEPQQDLHGYDAPWVGGSGKNKLQTTATSQTVNGVTFTVNSDGTIKATGKATSNVWFAINATNWGSYSTLANKGFNSSLTLNGCPSGGSGNTFALGMRSGNSSNLLDAGNGVTITDLETNTYYPAILIYNGYEIPSGGLLFKPMLRLSTVSDATFAPYSNECPISGWDEVNVTVADDTTDPTTEKVYTISLNGTRYGGKLDVLNGVLTVDRAIVTYDGSSDESWGYSAGWSKTNTSAFYLPGDATIKFSSWDDYPISKCNCLTPMSRNELYEADTIGIGMSGSFDGGNVSIRVPRAVSDVSELRTWLSSNNVQAVYELATPQTIQLTPTIIKSLQGDNNFFASTGEIDFMQYWGKEVTS